jgi:16S rRNA (uracil1498-N3)-methyltransferase
MSRTIRSFYAGPFEGAGEELVLDTEESYHLSKVLRRSVGDPIEVLNGKGGLAEAECISISSKQVTVRISSVRDHKKEKPELRMVLAMTKGGKWEDQIKPLTELGVDRITPLLSDRTEIKQDRRSFKNKVDKWAKLAIEACKQSGNPWFPRLDKPITLPEYLNDPTGLIWVASLAENSGPLKIDKQQNSYDILVGPEGGWTDSEESKFKEYGAKFFSLGKYTLRAETAGLSALAVARAQIIDYFF